MGYIFNTAWDVGFRQTHIKLILNNPSQGSLNNFFCDILFNFFPNKAKAILGMSVLGDFILLKGRIILY